MDDLLNNALVEKIKKEIQAMSSDERTKFIKDTLASVNSLVFDVVALDKESKSKGLNMPSEEEFCKVISGQDNEPVQ